MAHSIIATILEFSRRDHAWAEFWAGLGLVIWGTVNIFADTSLSPISYGPLIHFLKPVVWEYVALGCGVMQIVVAIANDRRLRAVVAFPCCWLFATFITCFLEAKMQPKGGIGPYVALLGIEMVAIVRFIRER